MSLFHLNISSEVHVRTPRSDIEALFLLGNTETIQRHTGVYSLNTAIEV